MRQPVRNIMKARAEVAQVAVFTLMTHRKSKHMALRLSWLKAHENKESASIQALVAILKERPNQRVASALASRTKGAYKVGIDGSRIAPNLCAEAPTEDGEAGGFGRIRRDGVQTDHVQVSKQWPVGRGVQAGLYACGYRLEPGDGRRPGRLRSKGC